MGSFAAAPLAMLLLGDGRFPAGGHVHSGGVEAAIADGRITGERSLEAYLRGRVATVGLTDAAITAAAHHRWNQPIDVAELDAEAAARITPAPLRAASRRQGRQLLRVARRCWPSPALDDAVTAQPDGLHLSVALGVVAAVAGLNCRDTVLLSFHHALNTPAQAAVRLLGLDPFAAASMCAALSAELDPLVTEAEAAATGPLRHLPARSGPICDVAAIEHATWDVRMFAT